MRFFWTWSSLKRLYTALAIIMVVTFCGGWIVQGLGAPDWVWSAICLAALISWVVVGALAVVKQVRENRSEKP
jgi:hypothetical protein